MRLFRRSLALFLSLLMLFALVSCEAKPEQEGSLGESSFAESLTSREENKPSDTESSLPAETDEPSDEGSDVSEEVSDPLDEESDTSDEESDTSEEESDVSQPEPKIDPEAVQAYEDAIAIWAELECININYLITTVKQVGTDSFEEQAEGCARYAGLGSTSPRGMITVTHTLGDEQFESVETYAAGHTQYSFADENRSYKCDQSFKEFFARQIPCRMFSPEGYGIVRFSEEDPTLVEFDEGFTPEPWLQGLSEFYGDVEYYAKGWAKVTRNTITELYFSVQYMRGATLYSAEYSVKPSYEEIDRKDLVHPYKKDSQTIEVPLLPYLLRYAANGLSRYRQGVVRLYEEVYNYKQEQLTLSEQTVATCLDHDLQQSMYAQTSTSRINKQTELPTFTVYHKYTDGIYKTSEDGETYAVVEGDDTYKRFLEHPYLQDMAVSTLSLFQNLSVETAGSFIILEGDLKTAAISPYLRRAGIIEQYGEDSYQSVRNVTLSCRLAIDLDTGFLTALQVMLVAETPFNEAKAIGYYCDLYLETGSWGAYATVFESPYPDEEPAEEEKPTPLFYQITDKEGHIAYLLGTIHIGDSLTAYLPQSVYDAFNASDALAVESNVNSLEERMETDEDLATAYHESYFFTDETTLEEFLDDPALYKQAELLLFAMGYSGYETALKPAAAASMINGWLSDAFGYLTSEKGVDMRFLEMAEAKGKRISEIEDPKEHYAVLSDYSKETQVMLLEEALAMEKWDAMYSTLYLYDLWCQGDEALLREAVSAPLPEDATPEEKAYYEEYTDKMVTRRDKIMVDGIKSYLSSGETVFVAVGLAHVIGEGGIIDQLKEAGYTVTLVQ